MVSTMSYTSISNINYTWELVRKIENYEETIGVQVVQKYVILNGPSLCFLYMLPSLPYDNTVSCFPLFSSSDSLCFNPTPSWHLDSP
mmetsp:Transcript_25690/g.62927  ORF Transcript_25690/g.62927 Transcript_25690/m.62927 type:complete len:87 (-) Transcript_25690:476-736(-)